MWVHGYLGKGGLNIFKEYFEKYRTNFLQKDVIGSKRILEATRKFIRSNNIIQGDCVSLSKIRK